MKPRIIRTREELTALDPDTPLVLGTGLFTVAAAARVFVNVQALLPAATVGDGAEVRAARQALEEA